MRLPDANEATHGGVVVPMFPLPDVFLFPGTVMPLHVFEPRYRQMIEDSLDGPGRIVMAAVLDGHRDDLGGSPPVHTIAGLGSIAQHERLPDGRFLIWLAGLARVLIREVPSDRLYRKVEALVLREVPVEAGAEARLRNELVLAIRERCGARFDVPCGMPIGQLADLLLVRLRLPRERMRELYECVRVADRARSALDEHALRPRAR